MRGGIIAHAAAGKPEDRLSMPGHKGVECPFIASLSRDHELKVWIT